MSDSPRDPSLELTPVPAQEIGTRGLFDRIKDAVGDKIFERDFGILNVERDSTATLTTGGQADTESWWDQGDPPPSPAILESTVSASESKHGILLIEEISKPCLEPLDATFDLDPFFVLAYIEGRPVPPSEPRHELEQPLIDSGKFRRGEKGKWCVLDGFSAFTPEDCQDLNQDDSSCY
jgi:hypothetical protein